jgi:small nuclear ribonucleoprotein (snRNP)-like protein
MSLSKLSGAGTTWPTDEKFNAMVSMVGKNQGSFDGLTNELRKATQIFNVYLFKYMVHGEVPMFHPSHPECIFRRHEAIKAAVKPQRAPPKLPTAGASSSSDEITSMSELNLDAQAEGRSKPRRRSSNMFAGIGEPASQGSALYRATQDDDPLDRESLHDIVADDVRSIHWLMELFRQDLRHYAALIDLRLDLELRSDMWNETDYRYGLENGRPDLMYSALRTYMSRRVTMNGDRMFAGTLDGLHKLMNLSLANCGGSMAAYIDAHVNFVTACQTNGMPLATYDSMLGHSFLAGLGADFVTYKFDALSATERAAIDSGMSLADAVETGRCWGERKDQRAAELQRAKAQVSSKEAALSVHSAETLAKGDCRDFAKGRCKRGSQCLYRHPGETTAFGKPTLTCGFCGGRSDHKTSDCTVCSTKTRDQLVAVETAVQNEKAAAKAGKKA